MKKRFKDPVLGIDLEYDPTTDEVKYLITPKEIAQINKIERRMYENRHSVRFHDTLNRPVWVTVAVREDQQRKVINISRFNPITNKDLTITLTQKEAVRMSVFLLEKLLSIRLPDILHVLGHKENERSGSDMHDDFKKAKLYELLEKNTKTVLNVVRALLRSKNYIITSHDVTYLTGHNIQSVRNAFSELKNEGLLKPVGKAGHDSRITLYTCTIPREKLEQWLNEWLYGKR